MPTETSAYLALLLQAVEACATLAFALSGLLEAARKRLDAVGVCLVAGFTAFVSTLTARFAGVDVPCAVTRSQFRPSSVAAVTFEMPSRQVFLHQLVGRSGLLNAIALNSGLFNASRVLGPALAGFCLAWLGESACFALNGLSYLGAIAALLAIRQAPVVLRTRWTGRPS